MRMYADILKYKNIDTNEALYTVNASHDDKYNFYVSINLKTKIVSFFKDVNKAIFLGDYNLNFPDSKINIKRIPNSVSLLVCRAARFAIETQELPDDISQAVG